MLHFAANLNLMYNEVPFMDRFAASADDGFSAVEYLFPYEYDAEEISAQLRRYGLTQALFNLPPGQWSAGERGMACLPQRRAEFEQTVSTALHYAQATGARRLHIMAGIRPEAVNPALLHHTYVSNLRWACDRLAEHNITATIEPLNPRDMPGYYLTHQAQAHAICAEVARPNIKVQMDFYHCQIVEGDLASRLRAHWAGIGHIQIAGVPDRHEPDEGEVNYPYLFHLLESLGYDGFVGCEYKPRRGTSQGLGWLRKYIQRRPQTGPEIFFTGQAHASPR